MIGGNLKMNKLSIYEATLSNDVEKASKANNIISYIKEQINSYNSNNNIIKIITLYHNYAIQINFTDLTVILLNYDPKDGNEAITKYPKKGENSKTIIEIYKCNIETKPKLKIFFNENALFHELIHYLDTKQAKQSGKSIPSASSASKSSGMSGYINIPVEFNAHFFHRTMPQILKYLEVQNEFPKNFDQFKNEIFQINDVKEFYNLLTSENKQRFLKRIGSYWVSIKNNEIFKTNGEIDDIKLNNSTQNWIGKIKNFLKLKESKIFIPNNNNMNKNTLNMLKGMVREILNEAKAKKKSKPSSGLTKKQKSLTVKKARAGKDIGKKGKGFEKVAKAAEKQYGSKEAGQRVAAASMWKNIKREGKEGKPIQRNELGEFYMVHLPSKDSLLEDILTKTTLQEFAKHVQEGHDLSKVVGVYKNEKMAHKLAEELFNYKIQVLTEFKDEEIKKKLDEINNLKALIGATEQYYKLKPNEDPKLSENKVGDLQSQLQKKEKELEKLQTEKQSIEEGKANGKNKK